MTDSPEHKNERSATYDRMLLLAKQQADALPMSLVADLHSLSPTAAANDAKRETWHLLARGIQHLKEGAPDGSAGSMAGAIEKASLRSSNLAQTLGVKQPKYQEQEVDMPFFQNGYEEAMFFAARLSEALLADFEPSKAKITEKLATTNTAQAFGVETDPAQLQKIFDAVKSGNGAPVLPQRDLVAMRKQTILSFNYLNDAYAEIVQGFKAQLNDLPVVPRPPRPHTPSKSFDL